MTSSKKYVYGGQFSNNAVHIGAVSLATGLSAQSATSLVEALKTTGALLTHTQAFAINSSIIRMEKRNGHKYSMLIQEHEQDTPDWSTAF